MHVCMYIVCTNVCMYVSVLFMYMVLCLRIFRITIIIIREKRLRHDSRTINVISSIDWESS